MAKASKKAAKKVQLDANEELIKLGARIKALRLEKGYSSYEQFAFDNDISRAQIGRYEQGKDIQLSTLVRVCNALGVTLNEFFSEGFD
jgi:transcriptional regulator with XRE-family HTH domain